MATSEDEIALPMSIQEAKVRVREIYEDVMGADNVNVVMSAGNPVIRSTGAGDRVRIKHGLQGEGVVADVSHASPTVVSRIQSLSGENEVERTRRSVEADRNRKRQRAEKQDNDPTVRGDNEDVEVYSDGRVEFLPVFTKADQDYGDDRGMGQEARCENCAHYIEGGACHIVQGRIEPEGKCEQFADVGHFVDYTAHDEPQVHLNVWGTGFGRARDVAGRVEQKVQSVCDAIKEATMERLGG